jgi:hypothetical protein
MANLHISDLKSIVNLKSSDSIEVISEQDRLSIYGGLEFVFSFPPSGSDGGVGMGIGFSIGGTAYGFGMGFYAGGGSASIRFATAMQ